jgi:hypothetical protein
MVSEIIPERRCVRESIHKAITLTHLLSAALAQIVAFTNLRMIIKFGAQGPVRRS